MKATRRTLRAACGLALAMALTACGNSEGASAGAPPGNDTGGGTIDDAAQDATVAIDAAPADTGAPMKDAAGSEDAGPAGDPPEWSACTANDDCTAIELGCCDHCNGGKLMSVHKQYADAASAKHKQSPCINVACTEMACAAPVTFCDDATCAHKADPAFPWGCAKLDEADCNLSPKCSPLWAWPVAAMCANKPASKSFQGCMGGGMGCGDAETCARNDATGTKMVFPSTCLPEGWKGLSWEECCPSAPGTCSQGKAATLGKICVQGPGGSKDLKAGQPVTITVYPKGCMSSSCTKVHSSTCAVAAAGQALAIDGLICLEANSGGGGCTADCNGGGFAKCDSGALGAGTWTAKMGGLSLTFKVPSTVDPLGGLCAGSQW